MITFPQTFTILISTKPIDMRRGIDGLTVLIAEQLQHNPQSCILFLFGNQQRNKIKVLYWDKNGFVMIYKRLERKKFYLPKNYSGDKLEITHEQLKWLLAGFDFMNLINYPELAFTHYN